MGGLGRITSIKTSGLRTVGKVILWVLVIFLIFRGVVSILDNKSQDELLKTIDDYKSTAELREEVRSGAAAFAENFVYEYYSFDGHANQDYSVRVGKYLAAGLDVPKPTGSGTAAEVLSAKTIKITFTEKNLMDVDVSIKVRYSAASDINLSGGEELSGNALTVLHKDLTIRVPVVWYDRGYAVDSMPLLIPEAEAADVARAEGYSGTEVSQKEKEEIRQMLESFFRTYYEGTDQELAYYASAESTIKHGLLGAVSFSDIRLISAYYLEVENEYLVNTAIIVNDQGQELSQELYLTLTKEEKKYYIKEISTRIVGIGGNEK